MDLKDVRESDNVEDSRGRTGGGFGGGLGGGGFGLLTMIGRVFGLKGILIAIVGALFLWKLGIVDPGMLLGGGPVTGGQEQVSPEDEERFRFVSKVLTSTEDVWTEEFSKRGARYVKPKLEVYRGQVRTGCGAGSAAQGPFYCPADQKVYIDLSFYDELAKTFRSPGDFAQAYVIAHEVGHHVQKLLGVSDKVASMQGRPDYNEYSVRLELQADFYAGVWAHHAQAVVHMDEDDIKEAMTAANAIGDDAIQKQMQGRVVPHSFTHGSSAQRMRWFKKGLESGRMEDGDTFSMAYQDL
ncbi:MAG: neutral zinc metallopeptidase [Luteolibacter sp.]